MRQGPANLVRYTANHPDLDCVDPSRGRRGELVAAFIIMQARASITEAVTKNPSKVSADVLARRGGQQVLRHVQGLRTITPRGAMIMCADNQYGVGIGLPACTRTRTGNLSRDTVTAILIQIKNRVQH
ncbi:hypothetical protein BJV78DRAFT_1193122 [Lactifluus subvellereus]|nr:hypothetical protein BJV78DRAFT_1193122 [Lactifluus subvellereus]